MLYVTNKETEMVEKNWNELIGEIEKTTLLEERTIKYGEKNTSQPEHPFVDFPDPANRIIALPAYVGGEVDVAGIKWIASFPDNINHGLARANSITILNSTKTGIPFAIFNSPLLSIVRTSSVSGVVLKRYFEHRKDEKLNVGIIGFGPIAQTHYEMMCKLFKDQINEVKIYDLRKIDYEFKTGVKTSFVDNWKEAYNDADVFLNATVTKERYVEGKPKDGSLLLDVSLRDYKMEIYDYIKDGIIIDNWFQVCRRNTDIENFHNKFGLEEKDVYTIADVIHGDVFGKINTNCYFFSPFGLSTYDMAIGNYYYKKAKELGLGTMVEEEPEEIK